MEHSPDSGDDLMAGPPTRLRMWGQESQSPPPEWSWVEQQLRDAGTYWVIPRSAHHPHPRPVWGVWASDSLYLSIGSPVIARELGADPRATVHLESSTDVVILEGRAKIVDAPEVVADFTSTYNQKYDWQYSADSDGPPTRIEPVKVLAWRAAGAAGRDGFPETGRWSFA